MIYVDTGERKVRFLDAGAGGFLGIGEKHFMIPVEAVLGSRRGGGDHHAGHRESDELAAL